MGNPSSIIRECTEAELDTNAQCLVHFHKAKAFGSPATQSLHLFYATNCNHPQPSLLYELHGRSNFLSRLGGTKRRIAILSRVPDSCSQLTH